jgi:hypothetical protein
MMALAACGSSQDDQAPTQDQTGTSAGGTSSTSTTGGSSGSTGTTTGAGGSIRGAGNPNGTAGTSTPGSGGMTGGAGTNGMAGSSGTGGAKPIADAGPVVVRSCNSLPAVGQWENITPDPFKNPSNMETLAVIVNPLDQTLYAAAGNKTNGGNSGTGVYKSTDCGATFTFVTTGMNKDKLLSGDPWAMMLDPTSPDTIYINNGYGNDPTLYKSTNAGVDFTALSPHPVWKTGSFVQAIAMEPGNPQHLALTFHTTCEAPYNGMCLSRSNDGGATWLVFNGPSKITGWQEGASLSVLGATRYLLTCPFGGGAWYTADEGQNWSMVVPGNFDGSYAGGTNIAPDGALYLAGANAIYKSTSNPLGSVFTQIPGSPKATVLVNDGVSMYASYSWAYGGNPVWTAKLGDTTKWTNMVQTGRGANQLAYDSAHHIIYAANWANGLWRLVTR